MNNRKSNVFFQDYAIKDIQGIYGIESSGRKNIHISPCIPEELESENEWLGEYEIDYDNVTSILCTININNDGNIKINYLSGYSIHGSSGFYNLSLDEDGGYINKIFNRILNNQDFINYCANNQIDDKERIIYDCQSYAFKKIEYKEEEMEM